jgi:hypothetical protein
MFAFAIVGEGCSTNRESGLSTTSSYMASIGSIPVRSLNNALTMEDRDDYGEKNGEGRLKENDELGR